MGRQLSECDLPEIPRRFLGLSIEVDPMRREEVGCLSQTKLHWNARPVMAPEEDLRAEMTAAAQGQVASCSEAFLRSISLARRSGLR